MKLILRFENKIISLCRAKNITKERVFELANIPTYKRNVNVNERLLININEIIKHCRMSASQ